MRKGLISKRPRSEGLYRPTDGGAFDFAFSTRLRAHACSRGQKAPHQNHR